MYNTTGLTANLDPKPIYATHAPNWNGDDRTLCGIANDAGASGDEPKNPEYAKVGERVTCRDCRLVAVHVWECFSASTRTFIRRATAK